jgi:aspartate kinase
MMQNSALSFSVCVDGNKGNFEATIADLKEQYKVKYNENVTLVTIRSYTEKTIEEILKGKEILLEQKSRYTAQFVIVASE